MSKQGNGDVGAPSREPSSETLLNARVRSLSVVEEPRDARGIRHPLMNVLTIAVLGCMCRCDDAEALEDWGRKEASWLSDFLDFPHGVPSQDVYLRVLAALDPMSFRMAFHVMRGGSTSIMIRDVL